MSKLRKNNLISEIAISEEYDWVDEDEVISDQKFVVLSFCEPDVDTLTKRETFMFSEFIKECLREDPSVEKQRVNFSKVTPEKLLSLYHDYKNDNVDYLSEELKRAHPGVVFERALKIRGAYKSQNKAQERVKYLKKYDRIHNIYVCEVGKWVPFNPDPAVIEDYETSNVRLNNMLSEKRKNQTAAKEFYERERQERIKQCAEVSEERNNKIRNNDFDAIIAEHCEQEVLGLVDPQFSKAPEPLIGAAAIMGNNNNNDSLTLNENRVTQQQAPTNSAAHSTNSTNPHASLTIEDFENADFDEELAESIVRKLKINS